LLSKKKQGILAFPKISPIDYCSPWMSFEVLKLDIAATSIWKIARICGIPGFIPSCDNVDAAATQDAPSAWKDSNYQGNYVLFVDLVDDDDSFSDMI
jgi:hypothetical protein